MKKLLLFLVLIFTTLNVYAKWEKVITSEEVDFYVQTDSIKRKGYMVTYWEIQDFKSTQTLDKLQYRSLKVKSEINCDIEKHNIIFMALYSEKMGLGKQLGHYEYDKDFVTLVPDTLAHAMSKIVCSKK